MLIDQNRARAVNFPGHACMVLTAVMLLAGCAPSAPPPPSPPAAPAAQTTGTAGATTAGATTADANKASENKAGAPQDASSPASASTADRQEITRHDDLEAKVHYPALRDELAPLDRAMHAYADQQKAALTARIKETEGATERSEKPGSLDLDFTIATQTQDFVSALAEGEGDFGGAHPQPLRATFTQNLASGKIVTLQDLFVDADTALATLSNEARRRLEPELEGRLRAENLADKALAERMKSMREMLEGGTQPKTENFAAFLVDGVDGKAIGVTLIFPAAQVASYVEGPQQIAVPARVFYNQLKKEYRDAFAIDPEDIKAVSSPPHPGT